METKAMETKETMEAKAIETNATTMKTTAAPASVQVLADSALLTHITALMQGVPGFVLAFRAQCAADPSDDDRPPSLPGVRKPQPVLWRSAVRCNNERVLRALRALANERAYASSPHVRFNNIAGFAIKYFGMRALDYDVFVWICITFIKPHESRINRRDLEDAVTHGGLELAQFLHEYDFACMAVVMDIAAGAGQLDVVRFLHEHSPVGCSKDAMDSAAENGHLDVVQFLHEHRTEGCTFNAMNYASGNGHLAVVQFLHKHRTEGCTCSAVNLAASRGHLACIRYLHEQNLSSFTTHAMHFAIMGNQLDVIKFLHEHRTEGCTQWSVLEAMKNNRDDVLAFLCDHRPMDAASLESLTKMASNARLNAMLAELERVADLPADTPRFVYPQYLD